MVHILDNYSGTWARDDIGAAYTLGMGFGTNQPGFISQIGWYFSSASVSGDVPDSIALWDAGSQQLLYSVNTSGDPSTVGWHWHNLPTPLFMPVGALWVVGGLWSTSHRPVYGPYASSVAPPFPLYEGPVANANRFVAGSTLAFPTTTNNGVQRGFDVTFEPQGQNTSAPATPADVDNKLSNWLTSTSDNTHQSDGLPWRTDANVSSAKTTIEAVNTSVGSGLGVNVAGVLSTVGSIITIVQAIRDLGAGTAIKSAFDNIGTAISGAVTSIEAALGLSVSTPAKTVSSFPSGTGTLLWTLANETDWDTDLAWDVPADLYVCTVTSVPAGVGTDTFGGVTWYHRLGSWAPLNGSQIAGPRGFLEFSPQQLHQNGARMPGLALRCKQATLGHVQAWVLA